DLMVFARHLLAGFRTEAPRFGRHFERALAESSRGAAAAERLAGMFLNELATRRGPVAHLVLDDYHEVGSSSQVHAFVTALLRQLPDSLRVLMGTRTPPPLALERLRVRGEIFELDSSHLRFTRDELGQLFSEVYGWPLEAAELEALDSVTLGWPTAVYLVHESLRRGPDRTLSEVLAELRGRDVDLQEFLAGEIHARLEPGERRLLERVAALQRFDAGLAAALTGARDSTAVLRRLVRRGLVRSFGTATESSFELHALVREFLRRQIETQAGPEVWAALEEDTADVLASRGEHERALRHYLLSARPDRARELARTLAPRMLSEGRAATLRHYLLDLPEATLAADPELRVALADALMALSEWDEAERLYGELLRSCTELGLHALACRVLLGLCKVLNMRGRHEECLGMAERGLAMAEDLDVELRIRLLQRKAGAHFYLGQQRAAVRILAEVKRLLPPSPDPDLELPTLHNSAMVYGAMGHFRDAIRDFEAALARVRGAPSPRAPLYLSNVAYLFAEIGQLSEARAAAEEGIDAARRFGNRAQEMTCRGALAQVLAQSGDHDGALVELRQAEEQNRELRMEVIAGDLLALRGRIFCARGQYRRAVEFLTAAIDRLGERDRPRQVEFRGLLAWCELRAGRPHVARGILVDAARQADGGENDYERMRTHYWLAETRLALGEPADVKASLVLALRLVRELGFGYFLAVQARENAAPLLHALEHGIEVDVVAAALAEAGPGVEGGILECLARTSVPAGEAAIAVLGEVGGRLSREQLPAIGGRRRALRAGIQTALGHIESRAARGVAAPRAHGAPVVRLLTFGPPRLEVDGRPLAASAWRAQRAFHLLIYLAIHPAGAHRDQLLETFWPGRQLAAGRKNFHPTLSYIRSVLPEAGAPVLVRDGERYRLDPRYPLSCDAWEFERLLEEVRHAATPAALRQALEAASTTATLPFLDGLYGDWADEAQTRMRDRVEQVLIRCGESCMQDEDFDGALAPLQRAAELDGFREQTRVAIIECLVRTGKRRAARVEYDKLGLLLRTELGVEPLPETVSQVAALLGFEEGADQDESTTRLESSHAVAGHIVAVPSQVRLKRVGGG
ncbi:MAG: BTAD domain-containing putative transcriptional regulator, partial [Candidatus Eisenbacteria bacterium]